MTFPHSLTDPNPLIEAYEFAKEASPATAKVMATIGLNASRDDLSEEETVAANALLSVMIVSFEAGMRWLAAAAEAKESTS